MWLRRFADFVAGNEDLRKKLGVTVFVGADAGAQYPHYPVTDGDELALSTAYSLRAMTTPGHTPGCVTYVLVHKRDGASVPVKVGALYAARCYCLCTTCSTMSVLRTFVSLCFCPKPSHNFQDISHSCRIVKFVLVLLVQAFTGDTLFIGSIGRPDLVGSVGFTAEDMATMMWSSIHDKVLALPDDVVVHPAHGAGSPCGKGLSSVRL